MTAVAEEAFSIATPDDVDRADFRRLFEAHQRRVYTLALRFTGDQVAAEDITQTIFLNVYARRGEFRGQSRVATWLYRVVWNAALDHHRRQRVIRRVESAPDETAAVLSPEQQLGRAELQKIVHAAIAELEPEQRMPMLLKVVEGMSYAEIAEALDWPLGTVASRMNRGYRVLAGKLAHLGVSR